MRTSMFVGTMVVVLSSMAAAHASIVPGFVMTDQPEIEGVTYNVWELRVTTDTDWTNSRLDVALTQGSMHQSSFNAEAYWRCMMFLLFPPGPDIIFDTYVDVPGGCPDRPSSAGAAVMTDTEIALSWFDARDTGPGAFTIAQITLTQDAKGSLSGKCYDTETAGVGVPFDGLWINQGMIVPEPVTLIWLTLGAALFRRTRSR